MLHQCFIEKKKRERLFLLLSSHGSLNGKLRQHILSQQSHEPVATLSLGIVASTSHSKTLGSARIRRAIISFLTTFPMIWAHRKTQFKQQDASFACELGKKNNSKVPPRIAPRLGNS